MSSKQRWTQQQGDIFDKKKKISWEQNLHFFCFLFFYARGIAFYPFYVFPSFICIWLSKAWENLNFYAKKVTRLSDQRSSLGKLCKHPFFSCVCFILRCTRSFELCCVESVFFPYLNTHLQAGLNAFRIQQQRFQIIFACVCVCVYVSVCKHSCILDKHWNLKKATKSNPFFP